MLLVDDRETELREAGILVKQRVRADEDVRIGVVARRGCVEEWKRPAFLAARGSAEGDAQAERGAKVRENEVVLLGEDLRRGHERRLVAGLDGEEHGAEGDEGFSRADVAVEQAIHRARRGEVGADFRDRA